jgi:TPR repeat protein
MNYSRFYKGCGVALVFVISIFIFSNGRIINKLKGVLNKVTFEVYKKAAEQGVSRAQNKLGLMYYNGEGVQQNYKEALNWYRKAAEQGFAEAQNNLGLMYHNGEGVQ